MLPKFWCFVILNSSYVIYSHISVLESTLFGELLSNILLFDSKEKNNSDKLYTSSCYYMCEYLNWSPQYDVSLSIKNEFSTISLFEES